ncbi:MAG: hypothetical protein IKL69_05420 [Paludibacteraceae bacterium]|nr:hypothetical protein [Paludibacteraceae bacterium]
MIKGDINNVIAWLDINGIQQWTAYSGAGASGQGKLFESDIERLRDSEIERFRQVMALSDNSRVRIVGKVNPKQQTGIFEEFWANVSAPVAQTIGSAPAMDADYIDKKIAAAVQENELRWREKELSKRESTLAEAEKEFKRNQEGIVGILIEKAAPFISQLIPRAAVAGVESPTPVDPIPVKTMTLDETIEEAREEEAEIFTDEEADRLMAAMARYKEADPEYLEVLESFVNLVCSGEPFSVFGAKIDYTMVKNVILQK